MISCIMYMGQKCIQVHDKIMLGNNVSWRFKTIIWLDNIGCYFKGGLKFENYYYDKKNHECVCIYSVPSNQHIGECVSMRMWIAAKHRRLESTNMTYRLRRNVKTMCLISKIGHNRYKSISTMSTIVWFE